MRATISFLLICSSFHVILAQNTVSLLENSPFMPPGTENKGKNNAEDGPVSLAKLQLRGITSIDGEYIFSVYNPDTRESNWIPQGESMDGLMIKSYDPEGNSVVIHSESENLSRQLEVNDYSASSALRPISNQAVRASVQSSRTPTASPVSPTGTLTRTQQMVQRPTTRNLETLRARREELAKKLRKQPKSRTTNKPQGQSQGGSASKTDQANGGKR